MSIIRQSVRDIICNQCCVCIMMLITVAHDIVHHVLREYTLYINIYTGFCDYDASINPTYGNHTWSENVGVNTVITKCISKSDSNVARKCLTQEDGLISQLVKELISDGHIS